MPIESRFEKQRELARINREKKKDLFLNEYYRTYGNITKSCEYAGFSRETFKNYLKGDIHFKRRVEDLERAQFDFVQSKYIENISGNSTQEILHYMKTKGTKYGYVEHKEVQAEVPIYERIIILNEE